LKARIGYSFNELPEATTYNQYFHEDIIQLSEPEIFLDCGAFTGDTLNDYLKYAKVPFKKYICLEPDPQNLIELNKNIASKSILVTSRYEEKGILERCTNLGVGLIPKLGVKLGKPWWL
jgi:hypothetical protein